MNQMNNNDNFTSYMQGRENLNVVTHAQSISHQSPKSQEEAVRFSREQSMNTSNGGTHSISQYKQLQMNQFLSYCTKYLSNQNVLFQDHTHVFQVKQEQPQASCSNPQVAETTEKPTLKMNYSRLDSAMSHMLPEDLIDIQCADLLYSESDFQTNDENIDGFVVPYHIENDDNIMKTTSPHDGLLSIKSEEDDVFKSEISSPPPLIFSIKNSQKQELANKKQASHIESRSSIGSIDETQLKLDMANMPNASRLYYKEKGFYHFRQNLRQTLKSDKSGPSIKTKKQKSEKLFLRMLKSPKCENWVLESVKASKKDESINLKNMTKRKIKIIGDVSQEEMNVFSETTCKEPFVYGGGIVSPQKPSATLLNILNAKSPPT